MTLLLNILSPKIEQNENNVVPVLLVMFSFVGLLVSISVGYDTYIFKREALTLAHLLA